MRAQGQYDVKLEDLICTCGATFRLHKSGRCIDAILHRLAYSETPETYIAGTVYSDGLRDTPLFSEDLLVQRDDGLHLVPLYSSDPAASMVLFSKWYDMGGTGNINMNRSGWSGQFRHGIARSHSYRHYQVIRTRLEWLPARALAQHMIEYKRQAQADDCDWIEGVDPVIEPNV